MKNYLNTLLEEKGIDQEFILEVTNENGVNFMPVAIVVDFLSTAVPYVQEMSKQKLVEIDFHNGDVLDFFKYIAEILVNQGVK